MRYRSDLERLATLDADTIVAVCTGRAALGDLLTHCVDESLELDELADEAFLANDDEHAGYYRQEASAWRATLTVLRMVAADDPGESASRGRTVA